MRTFGITAIIGSPNCGKTTLMRILQAASTYIHGFHFCDMTEDVIAWHEDKKNLSPLYPVFESSKSERKVGNLLNDQVINIAFVNYLLAQQGQKGLEDGIRHVVISGWPRSDGQIIEMKTLDHLACLCKVDISEARADENRERRIRSGVKRDDDDPQTFKRRWDKYHNITEPAVVRFADDHLEQFVEMPFMWTPARKALHLIDNMNITAEERGSLMCRINDPNSSASEIINEIMHPKTRTPIHGHSTQVFPSQEIATT